MKEYTPEQKAKILYHAQMAAYHRCEQWNHEDEIEKIVGHDVELPTEDLAVIVGPDEPKLNEPGYFDWNDIAPCLEEEEAP